jgi:uncharacterized protein (TIGR04255 family)
MTDKYENLENPPAIEAVFDIAVYDDGIIDAGKFLGEDARLKKNLPDRNQLNSFHGSFQLGGAVSQPHNRPIGFVYKSEDGRQLAQFRVNGFSYNRLAPYKGWSDFLASALSYWETYKKMHPDLKITRLGLRFINVINVQAKTKETNFFKISLKMPPKSDLGKITELNYRYVTEFEDLGCMAHVQFGRTGSSGSAIGQNSFVFDIDVYKANLAPSTDEKTIKKHFSKMREAKNSIFFSTLTDKMLEEFR